jgi:hypothetical protein
MSALAGWRVLLSTSVGDHSLALNDVSGDGIADLVYAMRNVEGTSNGHPTGVYTNGDVGILFGRASPPLVTDLTASPPDVRILGKTGSALGGRLVVADVDGDGAGDLFLQAERTSDGALFRGPLSAGTVWDLNVTSPSASVVGGWNFTASGDVNGDGREDLVYSTRIAGRDRYGVINGGAGWPAVWVLSSRPPDHEVRGAVGATLVMLSAGDYSGDGKDDLVVWDLTRRGFVDGGVLSAAGSPIVLPADWNHSAISVALPEVAVFSLFAAWRGDFDGDRREDIYCRSTAGFSYGPQLSLFLTSEGPFGGSTPTVTLNGVSGGTGGDFVGHDLDLDGKDDVLFYASVDNVVMNTSYNGQIVIFYGFRPLFRPTLALNRRDDGSLRVDAAVGVDGTPTDMRFTGDVEEAGVWRPAAPAARLTLTSATGPKSVGVTFRDRRGRESSTATRSLDLVLGAAPIRRATNRVRPGTAALWEISLAAPGRVDARVRDAFGEVVAVLAEGERSAGVWPVRWNGANDGGARAAPGVYYLELTVNGQMSREKVVVTP